MNEPVMESKKQPSLTVFFPAFNEEANIKKTVESAISVLTPLSIKWEIIVVNDGSRDKTSDIVKQIINKNPKVRLIDQANGGYGLALRTGFAEAKYDLICYTDADGQFDFSEVTKFLEAAKTADAVWGYRISRDDPFYRLIFAKIWKLSIFLIFGFTLRDFDCGFKLLRRSALEAVLPLTSTRGAMINAELAIKLRHLRKTIAQVGVHHFPRGGGRPTGNSLNVIVKSYWELFQMRLKFL